MLKQTVYVSTEGLTPEQAERKVKRVKMMNRIKMTIISLTPLAVTVGAVLVVKKSYDKQTLNDDAPETLNIMILDDEEEFED